MKHLFNHLFRTLLLALCALFSSNILVAQPSPAQCLGNIQKRLDALGNQTDFDYLQMRDIMKKFDFGEIPAAVADPKKAEAFKRVITSLSEFCDAAGNSLSAKGMKGYTKQSGLLINSSDLTKTEGNIAKLKEAFTHGGNFKGADFDGVMAKLGDSTKFDFDGATGTFTSKASGTKYAKHPSGSYGGGNGGGLGGEPDSITHIMRGHTRNDLSVAANGNLNKSLFDNPSDVLDLIDEAMKAPASARIPKGNGAFEVDLGALVNNPNRKIGLVRDGATGTPTSKILIVIRDNTTDVIHTAYPN